MSTTITIDPAKLSKQTMAAIIVDYAVHGGGSITATSAAPPKPKAPKARRTRKAAKAKAAPKAKANGAATATGEQVLAALASTDGSMGAIVAETGLTRAAAGAALRKLRTSKKAFMAGAKRFARWGTSAGEAHARAVNSGGKVKPARKAKGKKSKVAAKAKHVNGAASTAAPAAE